MDIVELKKQITDKTFGLDFMIFVCKDNFWLADMFVDEICQLKGLTKQMIHHLSDIDSNMSLVFDFSSYMNVIKAEEFNEVYNGDFADLDHVIVICNKLDKKLEKKYADYIVSFPKLQPWQISDYLDIYCHGLSDETKSWLISATGGDIYRTLNEVDKVKMFSEKERESILAELKYLETSDLFTFDFFKLTDAIAMNDRPTIMSFMKHRDLIDVDPIAMSNVMLKSLKKAMFLTSNSGVKAEDLGIKSNQAWAIKNKFRNYSQAKIAKAVEFLSNIDLKLKSGQLDMETPEMIDYIIVNII